MQLSFPKQARHIRDQIFGMLFIYNALQMPYQILHSIDIPEVRLVGIIHNSVSQIDHTYFNIIIIIIAILINIITMIIIMRIIFSIVNIIFSSSIYTKTIFLIYSTMPIVFPRCSYFSKEIWMFNFNLKFIIWFSIS